MVPVELQALLVLQDRDSRRLQFDRILRQIPQERTAIDGRIAGHRAAIEAARQAVTALELRRKEFEAILRGLEEQLQRYRSQQLQVKKNDEYQALGHEIELTETRIGETEEREIELLYELDAERARAKETEQRLLGEIAGEEAQVARLADREGQVRGELKASSEEVERARGEVDPRWLSRYDVLARTIGLPVVVPLHGQKCGGCHLKVSSGVETEARKGGEIVACDNCTRLVYWEP